MRFRDAPIQRKIMTAIMLTSMAVLMLTVGAFLAYDIITLRRELVQNLSALGHVAADSSAAALAARNEATAREILSGLKAERDLIAAALYDREGRLFASFSARPATFPPEPGLAGHRFDASHLVLFAPVTDAGARLGTLYLDSSLDAIYARLRLYAGVVPLVTLGAIAVSLLFSDILRRRIARPILGLARTARVISDQRDYSVRAQKESADEVGVLTDAFNLMLNRIQQQDDALREGAERLSLALEASRTGTWDWNIPANKLTWDDDIHALFGLKPGDFGGEYQHFLELIHPSDRASVANAVAEAMEQKRPIITEFRVVWPDGSVHHMLARGRAFFDAQGSPARMTGVCLDITERKRAEQALEESQSRQAGIIESAMDAIISIDADQRITIFNAAAEKMFRCGAAEALGQPLDQFIPLRYREAHRRHIPMFGRTGVTTRSMGRLGAITGLRADGEEFPIEASISQIEVAGQKVYTVILRDITQRIQAEQKIRHLNAELAKRAAELEQRVRERTAELEAANKELEAFTYSVAHDLRAPLRHINSYSRLLHDTFAATLPPDARRYAETIQSSARHLSLLVEDLLNLARVGRQELQRETTPLAALVAEVVTELKRDTEPRQIEWQIASLPTVECDPGLMRQVFANLLSNAVKYTRPRPLARIEVGRARTDGQTAIYVRDNGVGFSMKYVHKLFGVFQRLHRAEEFEGSGVGLATVERIIHKHGGRIWAEGDEDKGATFYFTLRGLDKADDCE